MAPQRAGARAGRVEQDGVELLRRRPFAGVGGHQFGGEAGAREVLAQPHHAARRDVDGRHLGAGGAELQRLAAGRGAEIGDALAGDVAQQADGQGGGGVLHPPRAFGEARQLGDGAAGRAADRAGRQQLAVEPARPERGVGARREVERRLDQMGGGDGARRLLAIGRPTSSATASAAC